MTTQTYFGIDFGTKKLGIAVGQTLTRTAMGIAVVPVKELQPEWTELDALVARWKPDGFVVGMPYNMDGTASPMSTHAEHFGKQLTTRYHKPCFPVDERLSTREARDITRHNAELIGKRPNDRAKVDAMVAQLLLESFLNP